MYDTQCARCETAIKAWPYRRGKAVCPSCLLTIRSENGRRRAAGQAPVAGSAKVRSFRGRKYRVIYQPDHAQAPAGGWLMEHRLVMERAIGRPLTPQEVVHHIDHDGLNNSIDNLELIESRGKHLAEHHSADGVLARMASYPRCACGLRAQHGHSECWKCWGKSQPCPTCSRPGRKMATRAMCHGCYKRHRSALPVSTGNAPNIPT